MDGNQTPKPAGDPRKVVREDDPPPAEHRDSPARPHGPGRRRRQSAPPAGSMVIVGLLCVAAAAGAAEAGCHPTGLAGVDAAYAAVIGALVTLAASRASRSTLLLMTAAGVAMSRGWLLAPAGSALLLAFVGVFPRRLHYRLGALIGALGGQVVLRWPSVGFHGLSAAVAVAVVIPVLLSAWLRQQRVWRRRIALACFMVTSVAVVFTVPVLVGSLLARTPVNRGIADTRAAMRDISDGRASLAIPELRAAGFSLAVAHARTASWWDLGARLVPVVAQQAKAISDATGAAHNLAVTAENEAAGLNFRQIGYRSGRVDLAAIQAMAAPLEALDRQVAAAQASVARDQSQWLVLPIKRRIAALSAELVKARSGADLGVAAVQAAPGLLGGDGIRHYLVAFMTPAETRGLDGFIGAFGELSVDRGRITLVRSGRPASLNDFPAGTRHLTGVPEYVARYGAFAPTDFFQDLTYSPDFPTVANVVSQMYPQSGGDHVDGVLALDPKALAAMLRFTGPLTIAGLPGPLTVKNAADVLVRQQYLTFPTSGSGNQERHDLLQDALAQGFHRFVAGSIPGPRALADVLGPVVRQGRLLFWSSHPSAQPLLRRLHLDGAFPHAGPSADVLAVTIANAANNKIDTYLREKISDRVTYNPGNGAVASTVTVSLQNEAPSSGLPQFVIGSSHPELPSGTNFAWLSVYSPLGLAAATLDGSAVMFSPGIPELGVNAYSAFVRIPARSTATVQLMFGGKLRPEPSYQLSLRLQPLVVAPSADVTVEPSPGWRLTGGQTASWQLDADEVQIHHWDLKNLKTH